MGLDVTSVAADLLGALALLARGGSRVGGLLGLGGGRLRSGSLGGAGGSGAGGGGAASRGRSRSLGRLRGGGRSRGLGGRGGAARAAASGGSAGGGGLDDALGGGGGTLDQGRAGDGVGVKRSVDVEQDALVVSLVQLSALDTGGLLRAGASDLEVEALGVGLGTVLLASGVESDDLVTENVGAGGNVLGDLDQPAVAVLQELVIGVGTGAGLAVDEALLRDLEELEVGLVDLLAAISAARSKVVQDGTLVGLGPGVPLDEDGGTSGDLGVAASVLGVTVADDVGGAESIGGNEAVVSGGGGPADNSGRVGHVGHGGNVVTGVLDAISDDVGSVTVGGNGDGAGQGGKGSAGERHLG